MFRARTPGFIGGGTSSCARLGSHSDSELVFNESDQRFFDFGVPGYGSSAPGPGIGVYVMALAMTVKITTLSGERPDEVSSFHTSTPSSRVWAPACAGTWSVSSIMW